MMNVRQFYIISKNDDTNTKLDLMNKNTFAANPSGLGVGLSANNFSAGQDTVITDEEYSYNNVTFTLILGAIDDDPYAAFTNAMKILAKGDLQLYYWVDNDYDFVKRDVSFISVSKGELDSTLGVLGANLELMPLTPWYVWKDGFNTLTQQEYNTYLTKLKTIVSSSVSYATAKERLAKIDSTGCIHLAKDRAIPCKLRYKVTNGGLTSFKMDLYNESMDLIQTVEFKYDFLANDIIEFSSDFLNPYCKVIRNNVEQNITHLMTTSSRGFIRPPANKISYLYFNTLQNLSTSVMFFEERIEMVVL